MSKRSILSYPILSYPILSILALSLLLPSISQACDYKCFRTSTRYNGNLGGLAGADAKCAAEFGPSFQFARNTSYIAAARMMMELGSGFYYSWVGLTPDSGSTCGNWLSSASDYIGNVATTSYNGSEVISFSNRDCNTMLPLWCCNAPKP